MNSNLNIEQFCIVLKAHQNGQTDYITFCKDCAKSGIFGWKLDFEEMTCTYLDKENSKVLVENIPT